MKMILMWLALSDMDALTTSKQLWGNDGWIKRAGKNFQIGCTYQGSKMTVATSKISWEDAFSKVNLQINGPRKLSAVARDTDGNLGYSEEITVYLCNASR